MIGSLRAIKQRNKKMEKVAKIIATYFGLAGEGTDGARA